MNTPPPNKHREHPNINKTWSMLTVSPNSEISGSVTENAYWKAFKHEYNDIIKLLQKEL